MARGTLFADTKVSSINEARGQKSDAFVNIYMTLKNGQRKQIGFIGLSNARDLDAAIISRLKSEGGLEAFANVVDFEFREVAAPITKDDLAF